MMSTIAFIASRFRPRNPVSLTPVLLNNFASDWASRKRFVRPGTLSATHTIRYFQYSPLLWEEEEVEEEDPNSSNFPIIRDRGTFERAHKDIPTFLQELRFSLALAFDGEVRYPCFTVLTIADKRVLIGETNMVGIRMDSALNPLHVFIRVFDDIVQYVCTSWKDVIKGLDQELSVKVNGKPARGL